MSAWKALERLVARTMGGVRSWDTDHDVLIVTAWADQHGLTPPPDTEDGAFLIGLAKMGLVELASIEVKNLTAPSVATLERVLAKNREKADRDGVRWNALVVKRKAGRGVKTPPLLVVSLESFDGR